MLNIFILIFIALNTRSDILYKMIVKMRKIRKKY